MISSTTRKIAQICPKCNSLDTIKHGKVPGRKPIQKWYCHNCTRFFTTPTEVKQK